MGTIPAVILVHAGAAFLVLLIGPINIFRPRRDAVHRTLGRTWVALMYITCGSSFFFGLEDGFTLLHGWPPGPDALAKRSVRSAAGMTMPPGIPGPGAMVRSFMGPP